MLQACHNSKLVIIQYRLLKVLKCYNFLWVQRRHNCSPVASFANCVTTLYLLKVHLETFLSIPNNSKMPNFELWHSCRKWAIFTTFMLNLPQTTKLQQALIIKNYTTVNGIPWHWRTIHCIHRNLSFFYKYFVLMMACIGRN